MEKSLEINIDDGLNWTSQKLWRKIIYKGFTSGKKEKKLRK